MPRLLFWLWATVVAMLITPIVFTAGFSFPEREYGPFGAVILSFFAWANIVAMTYIAFRAIGEMFGH
jgi:hypothetical protein